MGTATPILEEKEWSYLLTLLPPDLEESARRTAALVRCRNLPNATALLRLILAYAVSDLSLKDVAAWAHGLGLADLTGPGLFYRVREAEPWLQEILAQVLAEDMDASGAGWRLRIVDATVVTGPGATGTEWRAHARIEPATGKLSSVELTDASVGEAISLHTLVEGEILLGDCAYATARGLAAIKRAKADLVVRLNPQNLRVCNLDRERITLLDREGEIPQLGGKSFEVLVPIPPDSYRRRKSHTPWPLHKAVDWIAARVVAARTRQGEVIWVLTTLPEAKASSGQILELYRLRWQVELLFKRLKSLLHLDNLPSRQGPTARSWMLARLLAAALAQKLVDPSGALSPWGYEVGHRRLYP
jgi:Transposase DDE domain